MMNLMWWRKGGAARLEVAKLALSETDVELEQAQNRRVESEGRRVSLAEIRKANHFTQSIFPKGS